MQALGERTQRRSGCDPTGKAAARFGGRRAEPSGLEGDALDQGLGPARMETAGTCGHHVRSQLKVLDLPLIQPLKHRPPSV